MFQRICPEDGVGSEMREGAEMADCLVLLYTGKGLTSGQDSALLGLTLANPSKATFFKALDPLLSVDSDPLKKAA